mmetsp:Transcript_95307/g.269712  ORF Transcript_95307/g.269712 Transcript_95307/m.269712 type:complete len:257 (+) Transcript_95307:569-1339(+)
MNFVLLIWVSLGLWTMCLKSFSPCPSAMFTPARVLTKATNLSQSNSPPALISSKASSPVLPWPAMRSRTAEAVAVRSASIWAWVFRSALSLPSFTAWLAEWSFSFTLSIRDLSFAISALRKARTSSMWMSVDSAFSNSASRSWACVSAAFAGVASFTVSLAISLKLSGVSSSRLLTMSGFAVASVLVAAVSATTTASSMPAKAFVTSDLWAATISACFASSSFRRRSFSSSSARFSLALTSDFAMATIERRRGNFS